MKNNTKESKALSLSDIAKEMYRAINFTLNYVNRENRKENDYEVSFLYPANNLSYQKLLKAAKAYEKLKRNKEKLAPPTNPLDEGFRVRPKERV